MHGSFPLSGDTAFPARAESFGQVENVPEPDESYEEDWDVVDPELRREDGVCDYTVDSSDWSCTITNNFARYRATDPALKLPWESPNMRGIFHEGPCLSPPQVHGVAIEPPVLQSSASALNEFHSEVVFSHGAAYLSAVSDLPDLDYFENKSQQLELACSKWMDLLSIDWDASSIGRQVRADLRGDPSGMTACETLRSAYGTKSHTTLLKRAGTLKRYVLWHWNHFGVQEGRSGVFPVSEADVWEFFKFLRGARFEGGKGFTAPSTFLETIRFAKFTVDLQGSSEVLESRRLQGFAAIEKKAKGPTRQAPPLELERLQRLQAVLKGDSNEVDRLGAGCMLVCVYARARWSDIRYIHHVEVESRRNGCLVLYTAEHKTSNVGDKREQYLPLIVPWEGVTNDDWLRTFLDLYQQVGLDIHKQPLGPLMPAPLSGGCYCARPLTTPEASSWLKGLLAGTKDSHSLKVTLLNWCARCGLDKEVRAVLGHHQVRPIRKLQMLIRLIRMGMGFEEIADQGNIGTVTPAPGTPARPFQIHGTAAFTPVLLCRPATPAPDVIEQAIERVNENEEILSIKEEHDEVVETLDAAGDLSLFPPTVVGLGLIEISSSSGSDSESSSTSSEKETQGHLGSEPLYEEHVPEGVSYFKHVKSQRVHSADMDSSITKCKMKFNENFKLLDRVFHFKWPKCLRCFPSASGRIRTRDDAISALDAAIEWTRTTKRRHEA